MLENIFFLFFCVIALMLPLVFWMYIHTSFASYHLGRIHFIVGLILGCIVTSFLLLSQYLPLKIGVSHIFSSLSSIDEPSGFFGYIGGLSFLCLLGIASFFSLSYFFQNIRQIHIKKYKRAILFFLQYIIFWAGLSLLLGYIFSGDTKAQEFSGIVLNSIGLILASYMTLAFLEEAGKYTAVLSFGGRYEMMTLGGTLLIATLVALGFSLFENVLYSFFYMQQVGISGDLLRFILFRSIFSTTLHVLSSLFIAYGFWHSFGKYLSLRRVYFFLLLGFGLHSLFNIFLGFGYIFFLFIPLFGSYIFLSSLSSQFTMDQKI